MSPGKTVGALRGGHRRAFRTLFSQSLRLCCAAHLGEGCQAAPPLCPSACSRVHNGIQREVLRPRGIYKLSGASRARRIPSYILRTNTGNQLLIPLHESSSYQKHLRCTETRARTREGRPVTGAELHSWTSTLPCSARGDRGRPALGRPAGAAGHDPACSTPESPRQRRHQCDGRADRERPPIQPRGLRAPRRSPARCSPSEGTRPKAAAASPASGRRSMRGRLHRPPAGLRQRRAGPPPSAATYVTAPSRPAGARGGRRH